MGSHTYLYVVEPILMGGVGLRFTESQLGLGAGGRGWIAIVETIYLIIILYILLKPGSPWGHLVVVKPPNMEAFPPLSITL